MGCCACARPSREGRKGGSGKQEGSVGWSRRTGVSRFASGMHRVAPSTHSQKMGTAAGHAQGSSWRSAEVKVRIWKLVFVCWSMSVSTPAKGKENPE